MKPGIYEIDALAYHADPSERPSLSASIARVLVNNSPKHAWVQHPRLNPHYARAEDEQRFSIGTAAHRLFLEGEDIIEVGLYDSWRTSEAKEFASASRTAGKIPLLADQASDVGWMVAEAREQLDRHRAQPPLFADGKPEQTLIWEDDHGVICRARLDWLRDDYQAVDDLKTTSASADPHKWTRTGFGIGIDIQTCFYMRGVERLTGIKPIFRFAVQETYKPYALSVVDLAPAAIAFGNDKVQRAIDLWAVCLEKDFWPAYPDQVASLDLPTWAEMEWLEREGRREEAA